MIAVAPILLAFTLLSQTGEAASDDDVRGPKTLCFGLSSFALEAGERITGGEIGLHRVVVRIEGPSGSFQVSESEIYRTPERFGRSVHQGEDVSVFRLNVRPYSYAFVVPRGDSGRPRMVAILSGEVLTGGRGDASFYRRLTVGDPSELRCDHSYRYGWDVVLGEEP